MTTEQERSAGCKPGEQECRAHDFALLYVGLADAVARAVKERDKEWGAILLRITGGNQSGESADPCPDEASIRAFFQSQQAEEIARLHREEIPDRDREIARLRAEAECWEPDHTQDILRGDGMPETRRLPRVHCPSCTDAAVRAAVAAERGLLNEFMDATDRVMELAGKLDSDIWYRLTRVRQQTADLAALRARAQEAE